MILSALNIDNNNNNNLIIIGTKKTKPNCKKLMQEYKVLNIEVIKVKCDHGSKFKQLKRRSLKKIRASTGFEPMTSAIPVQCSTN